MANIKVPYAMVPAVKVEKRRANMLSAIARGLPHLDRSPSCDDPLYVACYGPSLRDTFEELRDKHPLVAMSGATKWLAERGIIADFALEMDPRESQLVVSCPPVPGVTYYVASCVCEGFFDRLRDAGNPVVLWHTVSTNWDDELAWVSQHDPGKLLVHAGSTVGLAAIHVGGVMGFSRFEIHGMDGSFGADGARHAGSHGGKTQKDDITWDANRITFRTSRIMANAVAESVNTAKNFPILTVWHGKGLTQELIRKANLVNACCADETEKRQKLTGLKPKIVKHVAVADKQTYWESLLTHLRPTDLPELVANIAVCEPLRAKARYNTGTMPFEAAVYLRALSRLYGPDVVVEIGTFIGTSTLALHTGRVLYTCDQSNDCLPGTESIITHPYQTSTQMLREIQEQVDLFFFDGRIQPDDIPEIVRLSHPSTVYVFDDFHGQEKGVANVALLGPHIPSYTFVLPLKGRASTLALLVPNAQSQEAVA